MKRDKWDARIQRAQELAASQSFAAEGLRFYERVVGFQKTLYAAAAAVPPSAGQGPGAGKPLRERDLEPLLLLPWFASFLSLIQEIAPPPLAQSAAELGALGVTRWQEVLDEFWRAEPEGSGALSEAETLIAWAFLQPYAECLADHGGRTAPDGTPPLCPLCSNRPQVGVLRPQGDGAKRSLICALCATEWEFRRIVCPACGEEDRDKLPVWVAEGLAHIRVEACDTCRHYIKTVDLTRDGRAVPVVDELATIPLSLWAEEKGYAKLRTNLLGI
ncbi:MAG TPA: formate dehydrogenase accessory protein FdhE [Thermoanaerobaculia bacterium]|nr:formate dehydrogenase accessory protein FdhE [Thermoanaerobaculia bacterium]